MKKHTLIHLMLLAILLLCMASCITFVGCNTSYNVTVHAGEYYGDLVWNASEESFETFMASFPKIDGKRAVYFFDEDYKVRADVAALTAEKLKREDCKDVYIKWAICEHTSAQNQSNGVDPTCSTEGKKPDYLCPTCGHIEVGESIPCLPHTYESFVENPATCTEPGTIAHKECEICHYLTDINEEEKLSVSDVIIPMIDHKQSDWIIDRQATCVSDGSKHTQCTVCRAQLSTEVLPALGHDITHNEAKEATCTEAGWHAFDTCSRCDYTTKVDDIAAKGHKIVKVNAQAATCTEVGWEAYQHCVNEGCKYTTYNEIPMLGHDDGVWVTTITSNCTKDGSKERRCTRCQYVLETSKIDALDHDRISHAAKEATCTEVGWNAYVTCSRCSYSTKETISALGHTEGEWTTDVHPTCIEYGSKHKECTRCHDTLKTQSIDPLGHDKVPHEAKAATCTEIGWDAYETCSRCDYSTYKEIPALGHKEGDWITDVHPTCLKSGSKHKECSVCNDTLETQSIDSLGHDKVPHDAKEATCTEKGWNAYETCSRCDYSTYKEILALGHKEGDWIIDVHPTCLKNGSKHKECTRCHDTLETQSIDPLGHDKVPHEAKAATCTAFGWDAYDTCSRCDYSTYEKIDALGHDTIHHGAKEFTCTEVGWDAYETCSRCDYSTYKEIPASHTLEHISAKLPTCTEYGYNAYDKCTKCDYSTLVILPSLDHDDGTWVTNVAPTCTKAGSEDRKCGRCQYILETREIVALGHDTIDHEAKAATCTEIGWNAYQTCSRCDYTTYDEITKLGHDLVHFDKKEPKCNEPGYEAYECCNRCSYTTYKELTIEHVIVHHAAKEPTCLDGGWYAYDTCARGDCTYSTKVDRPALGHDSGKWIEDVAPTCTKEGSKHKICTRCEGTIEANVAIDALGHDYIDHVGQAATCTEKGWDAYQTCSRCDYSTYNAIPALGHTEGKWTTDIEPSCLECGSKHQECAVCRSTLKTQSIDPLGHDDGTWVTDVAPTCTNVGSEDKKCTRCQHILETREIVALGHDTIDHEAKEATCTEKGWDAYQTCSRCDYTTYKEIEALGHDFVDCVCSRCSEERHIQDGKFCRHDNYIYFGTYPQSEVTDTGLTSILTAQAGSLPTENNSANWTSYGYYISSTVTDFMWYIDLTYSGEQYRGVYFTSYRPNSTDISSSASYSYQDDNGYTLSTPYWFKYEPIKWRVLSESNGEAMILCEMIIDSQEYSTGTGSSPDPNNYAYSNIRSFLNNTFYNTAFASLQKEIILLTEVDNSARSTNPDIDAEYWLDGKNYSTCANTNDYIFLLSEQEVTIAAYGFNTDCTSNDSARRKHPTAYAQCQGAYTSTVGYLGNDSWWLRSPSDYDIAINTVYYVSTYGTADDYRGNACYNTACGVVPALNIKLTDCKENGHSIGSNCICTKCGDTVHTSTESLKCSVCGDATTYYRSGDYIYFGTYPQNEVTNSTLKSTLTSKAGTLPTASNSANWTSYGYYISSTVTDFMWYIDLTYSGEQYRGVYFTSYRPYYTKNSGTAGNSWQDDNGYYTSTVYWFKYDPIKWRILNESNGEALILCEMIIDSREYDSSTGSRTISGNTVYPNNYEYSNIRTFLNNTFYNTAFSSLQKELILLTTVDNSARSSNPDNDSTKWSSGTNKYACSNTKDYIFLLSEQEVTTSAYGFSTSVSSSDTRNKQPHMPSVKVLGQVLQAAPKVTAGGGCTLPIITTAITLVSLATMVSLMATTMFTILVAVSFPL